MLSVQCALKWKFYRRIVCQRRRQEAAGSGRKIDAVSSGYRRANTQCELFLWDWTKKEGLRRGGKGVALPQREANHSCRWISFGMESSNATLWFNVHELHMPVKYIFFHYPSSMHSTGLKNTLKNFSISFFQLSALCSKPPLFLQLHINA